MRRYDPDVAPDPDEWLALDEGERSLIIDAYHRKARVKLPNATLHATIHAIVENQIAEKLDSTVRAMSRLMKEGLSRHDALHAIASVLVQHLHDALTTDDRDDFLRTGTRRYEAAVDRLTARSWRRGS
jgi:hypothetical protein